MDFERSVLGIELGSTRIKAVLTDERHIPVASGSFSWENRLEDGIWTYSLKDAVTGLQTCYRNLLKDLGHPIEKLGAIGVSAMMHGYLPFDSKGNQLVSFRTWRNIITGPAADKLTDLFGFSIPQRWCVAHLYQAMLNNEEHIGRTAYITTLAGYISTLLTGRRAVGMCEASGMFPVDQNTKDFDASMIEKFDSLTGLDLRSMLPEVLSAGTPAGELTPSGALLLDPSGKLRPGIPVAPCEGDAGTGMIATNSVRPGTGNVSAGTSNFAMIVSEKPLGVHREIDILSAPDGGNVAMIHSNNCTGDIDAWLNLFCRYDKIMGRETNKDELYTRLFNSALEGDPDCGGLLSYNFISGEEIAGVGNGRPIFLRLPDASFILENFMRSLLMSAIASLRIGFDILTEKESVSINRLYAHGGYFKTPGVGQRFLSAAINAPVSVMETAGEGGPYGMALLASYMIGRKKGESLADYLDGTVFKDAKSVTVTADERDRKGFEDYLDRYVKALGIARGAEIFK